MKIRLFRINDKGIAVMSTETSVESAKIKVTKQWPTIRWFETSKSGKLDIILQIVGIVQHSVDSGRKALIIVRSK